MQTTNQSNFVSTDIFSLQIGIIVEGYRKKYRQGYSGILSDASRGGTIGSGRTILRMVDLGKDILNSASIETFKLALHYANEEKISHIDLVALTKEKLLEFQSELFDDVEAFRAKNSPSKNAAHISDERAQAITTIQNRAIVALQGWVENQRVYTGNKLSPSLAFFNSLCNVYDELLEKKAPSIKQRFDAIYQSLESDNSSHWANAVHECRKIFDELADLLFPPQSAPIKSAEKQISVDKESFKNRLICFVQENIDSVSYQRVMITQLEDFGKKLDALINVTQKASHASITQDTACACVAHIYLICGGLLSLQ